MKSDKEFLDGIYKKADLLQKEESRKKYSLYKYIKYSSVAAIFILIPLLLLKGDLWAPPNEIQSPEPRTISMNHDLYDFTTADCIIIGEVENIKVEESKTLFNEIIISIDHVLKGIIDNNGSLRILSNFDHELKIGIKYLFFIKKEEDGFYYMDSKSEGAFRELGPDIFIDSIGNEYYLEDIKNTIKGDN